MSSNCRLGNTLNIGYDSDHYQVDSVYVEVILCEFITGALPRCIAAWL